MITLDEIRTQGQRITFLRALQSRWQGVLSSQKKAIADFDEGTDELRDYAAFPVSAAGGNEEEPVDGTAEPTKPE